LQSIDLALQLIRLGILRERWRGRDDRGENRAGREHPSASFDDHIPLLMADWPVTRQCYP
jgi:hypothetical protein